MRAFIKFNRGLLKMPPHWQLWLTILVTANQPKESIQEKQDTMYEIMYHLKKM